MPPIGVFGDSTGSPRETPKRGQPNVRRDQRVPLPNSPISRAPNSVHEGQRVPRFIDNILLGRDLAKSVLKKSFVRVVFNDDDAKTHWLSDHCPVGIELRLQ